MAPSPLSPFFYSNSIMVHSLLCDHPTYTRPSPRLFAASRVQLIVDFLISYNIFLLTPYRACSILCIDHAYFAVFAVRRFDGTASTACITQRRVTPKPYATCPSSRCSAVGLGVKGTLFDVIKDTMTLNYILVGRLTETTLSVIIFSLKLARLSRCFDARPPSEWGRTTPVMTTNIRTHFSRELGDPI